MASDWNAGALFTSTTVSVKPVVSVSAPSLAVTSMSTASGVSVSSGVPENVRVAVSNASQPGRSPPPSSAAL